MQTMVSIAPWTIAVQIINIVLVVGIPTLLLCLLQWWLSKRESAIPGLILPVLHVIISFILILSVAAYSVTGSVSSGNTTIVTVEPGESAIVQDEHGGILSLSSLPEEEVVDESLSVGIIGGADGQTEIKVSGSSNAPLAFGLFLLFNIPTYIYLIIYVIQRKKLRRRKTVDKTRIQDL